MAQLQIAELFRDIQFKLAESPSSAEGGGLFIRHIGSERETVSLRPVPLADAAFLPPAIQQVQAEAA